MIRKTETQFKRTVRRGKPDQHAEKVSRTCWYLLWVIPVFVSDTVVASNL